MAGGLFKRFKNSREQPEETAAEASAVLEKAAAETAAETALEPAEEDPGFPVPAGNALAKVWDESGNQGQLSLRLFETRPDAVFCPPELESAEFKAVLSQLNELARQWLTEQTAAAVVRAKEHPPAAGEQDGAAAPLRALDVNERCRVLVSQNGLVAWLFLLPASGNGRKLDLADGMSLLQERRITVGTDQAAVAKFFAEKSCFRLCPVAWGTPPTPGEDGRLEDRFPRSFVRAGVGEDGGRVDYRAQSSMQSIHKGDVICRIIAPREGTPGARVDGAPAMPRLVKPAPIPRGANTEVNPEGTQLVAAGDGYLEFQGGCFCVRSLLNVSADVDYSTGNIDFQGDIQIHGNVRELFTVKASGNITVDGMVEAAAVEAGGELLVSTGVSGNAQAVLRGRTVRAKYLESCTVYATEKVESDYIMTSKIFCDDTVCVTGGRGAIIASHVTASNAVKANSVGSDSGRFTEITLGARPQVREEMNANHKELEECREKMEELNKRVSFIRHRKDLPDPTSLLIPYALQIRETEGRVKALSDRQTELGALLETMTQCRLEAKTIYPNVKLTIGTATTTVETEKTDCVAAFDPETHEIRFS